MSRISFNRKRAKLKQLLGIRARLAWLALILVAPLLLDRARSLEDTRKRQIAFASIIFILWNISFKAVDLKNPSY